MTTRDVYIEKMKAHLDTLNASMNELEAKAKEAREEARDKYQAEMAKLDDMKAAGADTWEAMVAEMEKVRDAFVHSFSYFKSQL